MRYHGLQDMDDLATRNALDLGDSVGAVKNDAYPKECQSPLGELADILLGLE